MKKHWLTTLFGILAAIGAGLTHFGEHNPNTTTKDVGAIIATVGALGLGLSAADANKLNNKNGGT